MFDGIGTFISAMMIALCISVPLGLWKLVEIIIWITKHVKITD